MTDTTAPATTPVATTSLVTTIDKDALDSIHALAAKHVNVSYILVGLVALVLILGCFGGWVAVKVYDKEIQRAEAAEKLSAAAQAQLEQDKKESAAIIQQVNAQLAQDSAQRAADAAKIASLEQQIHDRDAAAQTTINNILASGKTAVQAYNDADAHYKLKSPLVPGKDSTGNETLTFLIPDVQTFTATKVQADTSAADLVQKTTELSLANNSIVSLKADIQVGTAAFNALQKTEDQCEVTVADKNKTIAEYKKAATLSKWQKFKQGFEKIALGIGAGLVGYEIHH